VSVIAITSGLAKKQRIESLTETDAEKTEEKIKREG
jgi:hypothetical protein